jgi:hypothetical protein
MHQPLTQIIKIKNNSIFIFFKNKKIQKLEIYEYK